MGAGRQFQAELLAGAAEGAAFHDVFPTGGHLRPIEVLLVERDVAHQAGIGVHPDAEHQSARRGLFRLDIKRQIANGIAGGRIHHRFCRIEQVAGGGNLSHGSSWRRAARRAEALSAVGIPGGIPASRHGRGCIRRISGRKTVVRHGVVSRRAIVNRAGRIGRGRRVVHQVPRRLRRRVVLRRLWAVGSVVAGTDRRPTLSLERLCLHPTVARFVASLHDRRSRRRVTSCRGLRLLLGWRIRLPFGNPSSFGRLLEGPALEGGLRIGRRQTGSILRRRCVRPLVACIDVGVAIPRPAVVGRLPIARGQRRRRSTVGRGGRVGVRVRRGRRVVVHRRSSGRLRGGIVLRLPAVGPVVVLIGRRPTLRLRSCPTVGRSITCLDFGRTRKLRNWIVLRLVGPAGIDRSRRNLIRINGGLGCRSKPHEALWGLLRVRQRGIGLSRGNLSRGGRHLECLADIGRRRKGGRRVSGILRPACLRIERAGTEEHVEIGFTRRQRGLAARHAVVTRSLLAGDHRVLVVGRRRVGDLRLDAFLRLDLEELRGLQSPLAGGHLAGIGNVARLDGEAVQHGRHRRVRVLALDLDIDPSHAVAVPSSIV